MALKIYNKQFLVDMMLHVGIKQDSIATYINAACIINKEGCERQPDIEEDEYPNSIVEAIGAALRFAESNEYFKYIKLATIVNTYNYKYGNITLFSEMMSQYEKDKDISSFMLIMFHAQYTTEKIILKLYLGYSESSIKMDDITKKLSLAKC